MKQQTFTDIEYDNRKRGTRREAFLSTMDALLPWEKWVKEIRPFYPDGKRGRKPKDVETMLRMYLLQDWFRLSDAAVEDAVYDSHAMRDFMHLDFLKEQVPGATTLRRFRNLLQKHGMDDRLTDDIRALLRRSGYRLRRGSVSDPVLISRKRQL